MHLFLLSTGFHYYFSERLIEELGLDNVCYAMYQPREYIEARAAAKYPVIYTDGSDMASRFGKKLGKYFFARKVFRDFDLKNRKLKIYSPYFNDNFVNFLRGLIYKSGVEVEYFLIPDGAALMRPLPLKEANLTSLELFIAGMASVPAVDIRHKTGSYSDFIKTVYHFPAKQIQAPANKLEIIAPKTSARQHNNEILILGGLQDMTVDFVLKAKAMSEGYKVKYRMHPKNRNGLQHILKYAPDWEELLLPPRLTLEEYMIDKPFYQLIGSYSSALVFNHLFIAASSSVFLLDEKDDNPDWHATADSCGIAVMYT